MIEYNTKHWLSVIFTIHKSNLLKILMPSVLIMGGYSAICVFIVQNFINANLKGTTVVHSLLGIVLGLLLVFRTNTAYDRWWEGRRLWGSLVNDSRNLAIKLNSFLENDLQSRAIFAQLLSDFCISLKDNLRNELDLKKFDHITFTDLKNKKHVPNALASEIFNQANLLYKNQIISGEQLIIIDKHISVLTDVTGACERIRNTPIPYSYNMHLKKYIFFYVATLPWGLVNDLGYISVLAVMMIFYAMVGIELIGEQIEDPFGYDEDDLPLDKICITITTNTAEILGVS